ncbi:TPA: MFS transporter [Citrobacter amalonaticus]|uniref:MFS transporter n=1 Tax=Citrobacter telavivensis TaxID=2653932 RepID=A0A6L5EED0_9ENTR|nr:MULTISPECIES: MFS transporter [Citrobacter]HCL6628636.1 MFS transporter [Citrobacter amalonaticus]MDM2734930.1 MFS transporter [Citrobacter sp. Ct235]MPQ53073.1 MFS transporter [Citrobacter telavivensis]QFS73799.1 MFS transporter [Citrobacter telavivensis]CAI9389964.1 D-galactonate transporter [Citrobacter sp. T1.2D-1]
MFKSKWFRIGVTLMVGLFVAYLDRSNLSIALPGMEKELGIDGAATKSLALTGFLIGYALANFFGGFLANRLNPKITIVTMVFLWSVVQIMTAWISSAALLIAFRIILGIAEGIYWPQQFRFARAWFNKDEITRGTNLIQFYGQFLALSLGFIILTPIFDHLGWKWVFYITGGMGVFIVVPMFLAFLKNSPDKASAPDEPAEEPEPAGGKISFSDLGGAPFLLLVFSYFANGMLFWGITLFIPMAVLSLGFSGFSQGVASALPYFLAILLAIPVSWYSDKTQKRGLIAACGLGSAGLFLIALPFIDSPFGKLALITLAIAWFTSCYTTNIWSIITSSVKKSAVGPAAGVINGVGAGLGGTTAGFVVQYLQSWSGSYVPGFTVLGVVAILGGLSVYTYSRIMAARPVIA